MLKNLIKYLFLLSFLTFASANETNINLLIQQAHKENKFIMFFHHIPGCPYCKRMLDENFQDQRVLDAISQDFLLVDIYTADTKTITYKDFVGNPKEFSNHVGAVAYPATIFMDSNGKIIHGAIGYRNIEEYLAEISYISSKNYQEMDLESYKIKLELEKD